MEVQIKDKAYIKDNLAQKTAALEESIKKEEVSPAPSQHSLSEKIKQKTIHFLKNKYNLAFLVVLFLAFLIRMKYIGQESIWNDSAVHLWYAIKVTREPLFFFSKLYLFTDDYFTVQTLIAAIYLFTKNIFLSGQIVAMLFGLVGVTFMYLLGSELKDKTTGVIAAALLGFNHLFWFYGVRILADAPLVTMVTIFLYCVVKLNKEKTILWGVLSALSILLMLATKSQSILFFLGFLLYLIIFKRKDAIAERGLLISWLIPIGLMILANFIFKQNIFFDLLNVFFASPQGLQDPGLKALSHFIWIFSWYLLLPAIIGVILIVAYKEKKYYPAIVFFIVYWLGFEIGVRTPEDRYILPLLPLIILFSTFALVEISNYVVMLIKNKRLAGYFKKGVLMIFVVFVCWNFYTIGDSLIKAKSTTYTGYQEAGEWLKVNALGETPIFAGSPRTMRALVGREYGGPGSFWDMGGSLWYLRAGEYKDNRSLFESDITILARKSDIYLEIDVWEYTQPTWYFPISQASIDYFMSLGFQLVKVIEREVDTQKGLQKIPVIFIFKKEKVNS